MRGRSRHQRLNYRTTEEIRAWAVSVLEGVSVDDLDEGTDTLRTLCTGCPPELVGCASEVKELDRLVSWIRALPSDQIQLAEILRHRQAGGPAAGEGAQVGRSMGGRRTVGGTRGGGPPAGFLDLVDEDDRVMAALPGRLGQATGCGEQGIELVEMVEVPPLP